MSRPPRPSAAIVLGALSGLLAGSLYMAISIPLVLLTVGQEERNAVAASQVLAERVASELESGTVLAPTLPSELDASWLQVRLKPSGVDTYVLGENTAELAELACKSGDSSELINHRSTVWASACVHTETHRVAVGVQPTYRAATQILYFTVILAVVVGIVTALGQTYLLRPLTEMARALERLGRGERRVQVKATGLAEFDAMVDQINEATEHVEGRVDAITARITVVQEMARMVAHEVRNPLQSLELLSTLIAAEEDRHERNEIAKSIREEIHALDQVVHRLLREGATTGALRLRRKRESIAVIVEHISRLHEATAQRRGVRLSVGLVSRVEVPVDSAMLGRSVDNLVTNALQAVSDQTGEVRLSVFEDQRTVAIAVDDNGPGVPEHLGDTIFGSDVTGRDGGTGLGLALVRAVIVAHGGTIEHSHSPLGGARFVATIPLEQQESP